MFLAFFAYKNFKIYQIDVKSAFLKGDLEEEVYIEQPDGFRLTEGLDMVCKLKKSLYGLKQASRVWYVRLDKYLIQHNFRKATIDSNLYFKINGDKLLIVIVYVDDIIFGGDDSFCKEFSKEM